MKKENIIKKVLKKISGYKFDVKEFNELIEKNPDDLKAYLMEKFPNKEAGFVSFVFDAYSRKNPKFFEADVKLFSDKVRNIRFENGELGSTIIKRILKDYPAKLRLLGIS